MLSSNLLVALCDTDAEEWKFVIRNRKGSLNRKMEGFFIGTYTLSCGKPKENGVYLIVDALLNELFQPDLIYCHKGATFESTMFGYLIDDAPDYVET